MTETMHTHSTIRISSPHFPVSVNAAFRNVTARDGKKAGRIKTKRYTEWANAFGWDARAAMVGRKALEGSYRISIKLSKAKRHPLSDLGNFEKGVQDALQACGVIQNDRYCSSIYMAWDDVEGVEVEVWAA